MEKLRLFDIPYLQQREYKLEDALVTKVNGSWKKVSTDEFIQTSEKLAYGLLALGITKGDTIACISTNNRHEWNFLDMAVQMSGSVLVPMYPTISDNDYRFIFNDA